MATAPDDQPEDRRGAKPGQFGQEPYEFDPEVAIQVANMAAAGGRLADLAEALGISKATIKRHYLEEWRKGRVRAMLNVGNTLYQAAMNGSVDAAKFYLARLHPEIWGAQREGMGRSGEAPAGPPADAIPAAPVQLVFVKTPPPGKGSILPEDPAFLRDRPADDGEG